jgi:hypothetical protein
MVETGAVRKGLWRGQLLGESGVFIRCLALFLLILNFGDRLFPITA